MSSRSMLALALFTGLLPVALLGCQQAPEVARDVSTDPESDPDAGYFESSTSGAGRGMGGSASYAPGVDAGVNDEAGNDAGGEAAREIAEADIIQLDGTKLYAMSRSGGLSVIDVSNPSRLAILGRFRTSFTPFEMYIRDGVVYAMYSDWGEFVEDASGAWVFKQTSALLALDVADPRRIVELARFDLPGEISDSRLVGDVLYTVSYRDGYCWDCDARPETTVVSVNLADPAAPVKVDELAFPSDDTYGWGKRSISVTTERIYIAGPDYDSAEPERSTIQVVDIADPGGDLVAGTTVEIHGDITSRWQMDEYEGVLRVISQPFAWWNGTSAPAVETFTVTSSQQIAPLAHLDMTLPRPETLQSVRFDGPRGYAVTFEQTDPLFTFDLADPAAPRQLGELEMPGFLYHMVPQGDRLIGLGYDQGNAEGAITVSIFDVSDLAQPTLLDRVNFGGTWGYLPEDQDRIHKAFKLDAEHNLMLVPFSGWQPADAAEWCGQSLNGVTLVDWYGDDLTLRGMTASLGQARRAFIAGETLFTVAEQEVAAYDITDRDAPVELSGAPLALNVSMTLPAGDRLVRLRQDWWSADLRLEVVPKSAPEALVAPVTFDLTEYLREHHGLAGCSYWYPSNEPLFVVGDTVWVLVDDYGYWTEEGSTQSHSLLVGFSATTGTVTGSVELPVRSGYFWYGNTSRVVRDDVVLLVQDGWDSSAATRTLVSVDLADPSAPRVAKALALPATGYYDATGLLAAGDSLITSYGREVAGKDGVVRHFLLRIDVSDPRSPALAGTVNVPGYVVDFDAARGTAVTLDHQPLAVPGSSWEECSEVLPTGWFDDAAGLCRGFEATLHTVAIGEQARITGSFTKNELAWATPRRGDGRLFFTDGYYGYGYGVADAYYYGGWSWAAQNLTVVDSATLAHATIEVPGVWQTEPTGQSLVIAPSAGQPLTVVDGTDAAAPVVRTGTEVALGYTSHLAVDGDDVFLAQGEAGVQRMTLP